MAEKTIVHITADFPDPMGPAKTSAVRNLIAETPGYRHVVYSLNRVSWTSEIAGLEFGPDRTAIAYGAPPRGLLLVTRLRRVAEWILEDLSLRRLPVDALHLHKLSVEGLVGLEVAHALERPFLVNIWGDTDLRILEVRRDLASRWKAVLAEARAVVCCAPWTLDKIDRIIPVDRSKAVILPYIVQNETFSPSPVAAEPRLVSVLNLDAYRRKNIELLTKAVVSLSRNRPKIKLDVFGGGSAETILELDKLIRGAGAEAFVTLKGPITGDALGATLRRYAGFVMPSRRETFGMVYVEALFAGLPVLYSRGWGIDGFFASEDIGYACDPARLDDIVSGVDRLLLQQETLKRRIQTLHERGDFDQFRARNIVSDYSAALERTLTGQARLAARKPGRVPRSSPVSSVETGQGLAQRFRIRS